MSPSFLPESGFLPENSIAENNPAEKNLSEKNIGEVNLIKNKLRVVLCWHMHQPHYKNFSTNQYELPWTYLHGIKDYVDMAAIIEENPNARAVVNFAPILLEQIEDYANQIKSFLTDNCSIQDPLLAALVSPTLAIINREHVVALIKQCLRANERRIIKRFNRFSELVKLANFVLENPDSLVYTNEQFLADLVVWYHLAWLGETVRRDDESVTQLMDKGSNYSMHDRRGLLQIIGNLLSGIIPTYKRLFDAQQVELCLSPYAHPILPLLIDFNSCREAWPNAELPSASHYPGGMERSIAHLNQGIAVFEKYFGKPPMGCWPSEGAISTETLRLLSSAGFKWTASGESVLRNSLMTYNVPTPKCLHQPYQVADIDLACFFRDDNLSDMIGFKFSDWHSVDAVNNLIHHLENIQAACDCCTNKTVSIILDGENCWEYYPENGYHFLTTLYQKLSSHPAIELTTYGEILQELKNLVSLPAVVAGSWVYGTFSTWIGSADKNRGWDALVKAKHAFDQVVEKNCLSPENLAKAQHQLAICEGSDWFWWFGDYNPAESVSDFERLYREHLSNLYRFLGLETPDELTQVMSRGTGNPENAGVMRKAKEE